MFDLYLLEKTNFKVLEFSNDYFLTLMFKFNCDFFVLNLKASTAFVTCKCHGKLLKNSCLSKCNSISNCPLRVIKRIPAKDIEKISIILNFFPSNSLKSPTIVNLFQILIL